MMKMNAAESEVIFRNSLKASIDILVRIAIIAGVRIGIQDHIAGGKVQCCRVEDIGTDVLLTAIGALGPHYDLTLHTAGVRRVGDRSVRGIVDALCVLHRLGFVSVSGIEPLTS